MVNCWGLVTTDTPALKVVSMKYAAGIYQAEISAHQLVHWLRHRQSLASLSSTSCRIVRNAKNTPGPVSMKELKEITLRKVGGGVVSHYIRCPSIRRITTFRIAPFTQAIWTDPWTVSATATDGLGGSVSTLVHLISDAPLTEIWKTFALVFQHSVTTLEVEDLHLIPNGAAAIPKLIDILPDLHTIRTRLPQSPGDSKFCARSCRINTASPGLSGWSTSRRVWMKREETTRSGRRYVLSIRYTIL